MIGFGGAIGGSSAVISPSTVSKRSAAARALAISLSGAAVAPSVIGAVTHWWPVTLLMFGVEAMLGIFWNVITVSLRQTIIPPHLLGRVNSVYRFFAWGMMPIGAAIGGVHGVRRRRVRHRDWRCG